MSTLNEAPRTAGRGGVGTMEKWMCWGSLGVAGFLLLLFLLDLLLKFPFGRLSSFVDILSILACGLVLFLSWDALRDLQ